MNNSMRVSSRKVLAICCILAVAAVGVVFAATGLRQTDSNVGPTMGLDDCTVTIYGNGVTFVQFTGAVVVGNGADAVQFYLPAGALSDTLNVSGINVLNIATSTESNSIINSGDVITVFTQDGAYTGKFISWDTMLLLEADNGTIVIPTASITRIVLNEVVQVQGPKVLVNVTTDSLPGEYEMNVSYLMRGPQWNPTYFVDLDTSKLQCWATIANAEDWTNVSLVLVSGGPHIVYYNPGNVFYAYIHRPAITEAEVQAQIDFTPSTMDEYHVYTYNSKLSFQAGTAVRLPLFNGTVGLRQEYFWSYGDVQNRYHLNDTTGESLASGTVEFYHGNTWVGEDSIGYTPVNAESIEVVNYADDIKVTSTVTKSISTGSYWDQGINVTITNYKPISVQILIQQDIGGSTLVASHPQATRVGSTLSWTVNISPVETVNIYYEWSNS